MDVPTLSENEHKANIKFMKIRDDLLADGQMHFLEGYYDSMPVISNSSLFHKLHKMPKGAHLHLHLTAACRLDFLMELTKDECIYYNEEKNKLKVFPLGDVEDGYIQTGILREKWDKEGTFDEFIKWKILLNAEDIKSKHSSTIWCNFQHKFNLTFHLYNYSLFFERILFEIMHDSIKEKVYVMEFRHIFGCVFGKDHKELNFKDEIAIFDRCLKKAQDIEPLFT